MAMDTDVRQPPKRNNWLLCFVVTFGTSIVAAALVVFAMIDDRTVQNAMVITAIVTFLFCALGSFFYCVATEPNDYEAAGTGTDTNGVRENVTLCMCCCYPQ